MVDITEIDHVTVGLAQLPSQWEDKPVIRGVLESWLTPLNTTEQCLIDTRDGFNILTAVGNQLDIIGAYFDESRKGRSDTEYRNAILAVIAANNGSGTPFQVSDLFATLSNTSNTADISYYEHYPLSVVLYSQHGDAADLNVIACMLNASPACIEYGAVMYDPDGFGWLGNDTAAEDANLLDNLDQQIIDDLLNNIVVVANFEIIDDGTLRSSFIDTTVDGTSVGYGENYGNAFGGIVADQSQFVDAVINGNPQTPTLGTGLFVPWASLDEFDPISETSNKVEPIRQIKDSGIKRKQPMARQFFNWMMANIDSWFQYVSDRTVVGTIRISEEPVKIVLIDTVLDSQLYRVTINAVNYDYTSDSDATLAEITAGLAAALTTGAVTGIDNGDGTVTIRLAALYTFVTTVNANMTIIEDFPFRFGGTWDYNGTQTLATITTYVFERTT